MVSQTTTDGCPNQKGRSHRQSNRLRRASSFETQLRRNAGQFLSSIPLSSQDARNVSASSSATDTAERSRTVFELSVSISSLRVFTYAMCTRPQTRNTISVTPPTTRSILKVIGSHFNIERRNVSLARNNLDFV